MVCRACGKNADHWSESCPYISVERFVDIPPRLVDEPYLSWRNYKNSLRVTNLSEDTSEGDLFELFSYFGTVVRVYVDIDQETGICRGFGFVNFVSREDSQRAINKLNGYGYDSLILRVEWATPT
ncbi:eukaryotic translation initiation factor 3 subunit G-like [Vicia villosa]|uniref:eukaryotic translation initiation factor 3 subunit G-like n=1 Tax=Vicia villosa TaxID=3911 RepID=UPI00273AE20C|nr:eukaryotic translation initiation factor 3 subunit G-like [Vicia villosa]